MDPQGGLTRIEETPSSTSFIYNANNPDSRIPTEGLIPLSQTQSDYIKNSLNLDVQANETLPPQYLTYPYNYDYYNTIQYYNDYYLQHFGYNPNYLSSFPPYYNYYPNLPCVPEYVQNCAVNLSYRNTLPNVTAVSPTTPSKAKLKRPLYYYNHNTQIPIPCTETVPNQFTLEENTDNMSNREIILQAPIDNNMINTITKPDSSQSVPLRQNTTIINLNTMDDSDDDVIFVRKYKCEDSPNLFTQNPPPEIIIPLIPISYQQSNEIDAQKKVRKERINKSSRNAGLRRNPKRNTINPNYDLDNELISSEINKNINVTTKTKKLNTKRETKCRGQPKKVSVRRSTRQMSNVGAVYNPPSPLTWKDFREWPAEGMHERPFYNAVTQQLQPFDYDQPYITRNNSRNTDSGIASPSSNTTSIATLNSNLTSIATPNSNPTVLVDAETPPSDLISDLNNIIEIDLTNDTIPNISLTPKNNQEIFREYVRNVIEYIRTLIPTDGNSELKDYKQNAFLNIFGLEGFNHSMPTAKDVDQFKESLEYIVTLDEDIFSTKQLVTNTIILFCIVHQIDIKNVGKHIENVASCDIIRLSNEVVEAGSI